MQITKEVLLADIEQKKQQVYELMGVIKYTESLIKYLETEESKKEDNNILTSKT
jgi:hypothetical protein